MVRNLALFNSVLIMMMVGYAYYLGMPPAEIIPLVLSAVLGSIPVALPATFGLASVLGARALAKLGVLPTRLTAVDEAASMDVLCADKTGTLTRNELKVTSVRAMPGFDADAGFGVGRAGQLGGRAGPGRWSHSRGCGRQGRKRSPHLVKFVPFDPATKMSEATVAHDRRDPACRKGCLCRGVGLAQPSPTATAAATELEGQGFGVLAVAAGPLAAMAALRQAFIQPDRASASQMLRHVADQLRAKWPKLAAFIDESETEVLAHLDFPAQHRTKIHSTNPLERLNKEVKRSAGACPGEGISSRKIGVTVEGCGMLSRCCSSSGGCERKHSSSR